LETIFDSQEDAAAALMDDAQKPSNDNEETPGQNDPASNTPPTHPPNPNMSNQHHYSTPFSAPQQVQVPTTTK